MSPAEYLMRQRRWVAIGIGVAAAAALISGAVLDVIGAQGATGSASIPGDQEFVEVPLAGNPGGPYRIDATLTYRVGGFLLVRKATFADPG